MGVKLPAYFDHQSTTPVDPKVLDAMLPYYKTYFGNPSSKSHAHGWVTEQAVEAARQKIAKLIGATGEEIIFTSGATESNNLALKGILGTFLKAPTTAHVISTEIEHPSVLETLKRIEKSGIAVTYLPVNRTGQLSVYSLEKAIRKNTVLISVMLANNEIGTIQPVTQIGELAKERKIYFHCDAAQGLGTINLDVEKANIDLLSMSAHKMYGPKGIGALYVRAKQVYLSPQLQGGGQEKGVRSGTLNVSGIVGFGKAAEIAIKNRFSEAEKLNSQAKRLLNQILEKLPDTKLNGHPTMRLPGNLHLSFPHVNNSELVAEARKIAFSTGSACATETGKPSHVLSAIGIEEELQKNAVRLSIGRFTTDDEIFLASQVIVEKVKKLRNGRFYKTRSLNAKNHLDELR